MFRVIIDDNFHLHDESERDERGMYPTYAAARAEAERIVDKSLRHLYRDGMTGEVLYDYYKDFGDDPFIRPAPAKGAFSAWKYAEGRAAGIVDEKATLADP